MSVVTKPVTMPAPSFEAGTEDNYLTHTSGFLSWALTLDHKRIGLMYLAGVMASFAGGGVLALLIRLHLWNPNIDKTQALFSNQVYNQIFTLHGAIMVFLFIIPSIPAALGNFLLPIMLGTKDVAFPRLNLGSFYLWIGGAMFFLFSLFATGLDTGWTFYTPYSIESRGPVVAATDYMRMYADQIRTFVPGSYTTLGTDGYGRSDTREQLRHFFEVNAKYIAVTALYALAEQGEIEASKVTEAMKKYGIDPKKLDPVIA